MSVSVGGGISTATWGFVVPAEMTPPTVPTAISWSVTGDVLTVDAMPPDGADAVVRLYDESGDYLDVEESGSGEIAVNLPSTPGWFYFTVHAEKASGQGNTLRSDPAKSAHFYASGATLADFRELDIAMKAAVAGDAALLALLGTGNQKLYRIRPIKNMTLPVLFYEREDAPKQELDTYGGFDVAYTISIAHASPDVAAQIAARVDGIFFDQRIETANYKVIAIRRTGTPINIDTGRKHKDGNEIVHTVMRYGLRTYRK